MRIPHFALTLVAMGCIISANIKQSLAQQPAVTVSRQAPSVQQYLQPDNSRYLQTSQILGLPTSHCGHVIDLMMKNRLREQMGTNGKEQMYLPHLTAGMKPGDLELLCVQLVCDGDTHKGPVFQIEMKNNSQVPIGNFQVSLVGVVCQIQMHSPTTTVCISRMEPCEVKQIQIQLPVTCMCMGTVGQQAAFDTVIVAIDSCDDLMECDELNNVRILKRCDVPLLVVETPVAPQLAPAQVAPTTVVPSIPVEKNGSPLDNLDLDQLELETAKSLQFRI